MQNSPAIERKLKEAGREKTTKKSKEEEDSAFWTKAVQPQASIVRTITRLLPAHSMLALRRYYPRCRRRMKNALQCPHASSTHYSSELQKARALPIHVSWRIVS